MLTQSGWSKITGTISQQTWTHLQFLKTNYVIYTGSDSNSSHPNAVI